MSKKLIDRLRRVLKVHGISQTDIARRIGTQPHTVNKWLAGTHMVRSGLYENRLRETLDEIEKELE